jgi:DNA replication and repair protein RecF
LFLQNLALRNFRNYNYLDMTFDSRISILVGENAQGKTNLLESVYLLAAGVSPRVQKDEELVKWNEDFFAVKGKIQKELDTFTVALTYAKGRGKSALVDNKRQKRLSDLIGLVNVVYFSPDSLDIVKGAPGGRRTFIDFDLCQINALYKDTLIRYKKVIRQRNAFLKELREKRRSVAALDAWDRQVAELGAYIVDCRLNMISNLSTIAMNTHKIISGGKEGLRLWYSSAIPVQEKTKSEISALLYEKLRSLQHVEIMRGTTLVGPHRDDIAFLLNDSDLKTYGSQGQQRTAVLACKLAELELIKGHMNEYPLLLLDDVMSELDEGRRLKLLDILEQKVQTFITATNSDSLDQALVKNAEFFEVSNGCVRCRH